MEYLSDDFRRPQAAYQAALRGQAESAAERTANLCGDANGSFVAARYQDRFDAVAVLDGKKQLLGTIFTALLLQQGERADVQLLLKALTKTLGQVGHIPHAGRLPLVNPFADLTGTKFRLSPGGEKAGNLVMPQVAQIESRHTYRLLPVIPSSLAYRAAREVRLELCGWCLCVALRHRCDQPRARGRLFCACRELP